MSLPNRNCIDERQRQLQARHELVWMNWPLLVTVIGLPLAQLARAEMAAPYSEESRRKAETLLKQMTVEEKVGQMTEAAGVALAGVSQGKPDDLIARGGAGSIAWLIDAKEINRLQHIAVERSRLHIPLLFGFDVIHGYRTVFPVPLAMASSWDPHVEELAQRFASEDARAAGIRLTFTPMVDIARDARWGRIVEGAGEDPYLGAVMAQAQVRGFQGATVGAQSVLVCVKHFAGYGAAEGGRDYDSSYLPEELLRNVYLEPFRAAVQQGAGSLMSAYMDLNDVPATGNRWLLTDVLRNDWGFQGFVLSDALAVGSLITHGYASDGPDAALKAFTAGLNMDMASQTYSKHLARLVKEGAVTAMQLDAAVLPILALKYQMGLFEQPYLDEANVEATLNRPEGLALARKLAARSVVLLKNENRVLPLSKAVKKVAVIGPLGDSTLDIEGGWSVETLFGSGTKSHPVTVRAGIRNKLGSSAQVTYVAGPMPQREYAGLFDLLKGTKKQPPPTQAEINDVLGKVRSAAADADVVNCSRPPSRPPTALPPNTPPASPPPGNSATSNWPPSRSTNSASAACSRKRSPNCTRFRPTVAPAPPPNAALPKTRPSGRASSASPNRSRPPTTRPQLFVRTRLTPHLRRAANPPHHPQHRSPTLPMTRHRPPDPPRTMPNA